jgi:hypothetical protein
VAPDVGIVIALDTPRSVIGHISLFETTGSDNREEKREGKKGKALCPSQVHFA